MVYARAYDQTVEADYYAAMSRVEQRLALVEEPEEISASVGENERTELLKLADQLVEPEIVANEVRLDLVLLMRALLNGKNMDQTVDRKRFLESNC